MRGAIDQLPNDKLGILLTKMKFPGVWQVEENWRREIHPAKCQLILNDQNPVKSTTYHSDKFTQMDTVRLICESLGY